MNTTAAVDRELVDDLERPGTARMVFESSEFHGIAVPQESFDFDEMCFRFRA
jgi:hypothetical protein